MQCEVGIGPSHLGFSGGLRVREQPGQGRGDPLNIQIFGVKNDSTTRKALRFFQERRIQIHFVDFKVKGPSKGELKRFAQKFGGAERLIDRDAARFKALGLETAYYGDDRWLEIAVEEPMILRQPLVRNQNQLTVGLAEAEWKDWTRR